ncbi:hypothetical protein [Shewanella aegiceratis]|uniref:hypothetical protein n=1 Tax=Shewanella aegiceratis TaxID=2864203 RepID=UPI001C65F7FE|nr:hypothetical protein [Shewanella aegiceratis]QYJ81285.1 hypothetical protein K0H80_13280 [Shewanella aegiceratis]
MSEGFATTYAKAIDDLAGKIFIPGVIASLLVELGPTFQAYKGAGLLETYLVFVIGGFILTGVIFMLLTLCTIYLFKGKDAAPIISIALMPLGFACLFPTYFSSFQVPLSEVTGVAILAWCFMLLSEGTFGILEKNV